MLGVADGGGKLDLFCLGSHLSYNYLIEFK